MIVSSRIYVIIIDSAVARARGAAVLLGGEVLGGVSTDGIAIMGPAGRIAHTASSYSSTTR